MGNQSQKERLLRYIDQAKVEKLKQILEMSPNLINQDLASDILQTPLVRAVWRNDKALVQIILDFGANPNQGGSASITPLMWACKRDNLQIVSLLIQSGADINIRSNQGFSALDYSILHGNYRPALYLFEFIQEILQFSSYYQFAQDNDYRYVNYEIMITHLKLKTEYQLIPNIYEKPKKQQLLDPVIDPRETWGDFIYRQIEFQNPPLVERDELPSNLQPQNRIIGKIRQQINGLPVEKSKSQQYKSISPQNQKNDSLANQNQNQISFT
ncbi:unnamed protein product (macronuclear) [Paramecium tetraurelia]|uniref:Uncharacterized protein n=1 Tax=Paramecium tetraurelia TaxID=5888 RepID=A0CTH4_PARTE|nr:uncharacterized protein GSPATT00010325001 [Paramecium tetraurelia]CAK74091.1 unnamed protein product [Paramecium tetraurelia]|eukprot:XP_001441488.1 hypothetical protein (macronuclear) [Paramecium tetraurelia strain d4-2]